MTNEVTLRDALGNAMWIVAMERKAFEATHLIPALADACLKVVGNWTAEEPDDVG